LENLTSKIGHLKNLELLTLYKNNLNTIPVVEIRNLSSLKDLYIGDSKLETLLLKTGNFKIW